MKPPKKTIRIVKHTPTDDKFPIITKVNNNNIIEEYHEDTKGREGFTLAMLRDRWDKSTDEIIEILIRYKVPVHISYKGLESLSFHEPPIDRAIFFSEDIYSLEKRENIQGIFHTKN